MNFKQFQDTKERINNHKDSESYGEGVIGAFVYLDSFMEGYDITESICIEILNEKLPYYIMIDRSDYQTGNLEKLEKLLYSFCLEEGYIEKCKVCNGSEGDIDDERAPCRYCKD